jgi:hypothetical protein
MDDQAREQAYVNAVATELFVAQAARGAIVSEMTGRGMIFMGAVSSALIAFGFLAPTGDLAPFVACVLPALLLFGELTFAALLRNTVENVVLLRHMQDIRAFYRTLAPDDHRVFDAPHADAVFGAAVATIGMRGTPAQALFTGASTVAAVNAMLAGVGAALLLWHVGAGTAAAIAVGVPVAVAWFALHVGYQQRRIGRL